MNEPPHVADTPATEADKRAHRLFMRRPWLDEFPTLPPLPAGYLLRPYEPDDLPRLATLLTRAFAEPWDERRVRDVLTDARDVDTVFVIAADAAILATASALLEDDHAGTGILHYVAADPRAQGQGLGATVSVAVLRRFRELGLRDAALQTHDFRLPAVRSYLRLGFVPDYRDHAEQVRWARLFPTLLR